METSGEPESQDLGAKGEGPGPGLAATEAVRVDSQWRQGAGPGAGRRERYALHPRFPPSGRRFWKLEC